MRLVTGAEMRAIDRRAQSEFGLPEIVLMENAGLRVVEVIGERLGNPADLKVVVCCGKGNNGGDGFVIARHLHNAGALVRVHLVADPAAIGGSARVNFDILARIGVEVIVAPGQSRSPADESLWRDTLVADLAVADVVVDALLGTGVTGTVGGDLAEVIDLVNELAPTVVAVDIPSGVSADTGACCGTAIAATVTVTFGLPKLGLVLHPGAELAGELVIADISLPPDTLALPAGGCELLTPDGVADMLPRRSPTAHKGDAGRAVIIAGARGFTGAAVLVAEATLRSGAGLVTVLAPEPSQPVLATKLTEAMTGMLPATGDGALAPEAAGAVARWCDKADAIAVGPGLGATPGTAAVVRELLTTAGAPVIIDADGLNVLADAPVGKAATTVASMLAASRRQVILTPHPGEMARLTGLSIAAIEADRIKAARDLARDGRCVVVLKGVPTVIAGPEGDARVNPTGNSGMATGGMGDALTGVIAGLVAQGSPAFDAASAAVFIHGLAGDLAAERLGPVGLVASDVIGALPGARRQVEES